ncbi:MAG: aminopeptidase P family protein [Clostridia bacterium]|nr:aminopeptidase P family protein [Clostridia bacterium]
MKILCAIKNAFNAYKKAFDITKPTEELFKAFTNSLDNELKSYEIVYDYICGKDTVNVDGHTNGYYLKKGDAIIMDISVCHEGKWNDVTRTYFVGEPTAEQKNAYELIKNSLKAGESVLKHGALACDIYNAVNGVFKEKGKTLIHHAGHVIAKEVITQPQFLKENTGNVSNGDIVAIESGLYSGFGIRLENNYLITENGAQNLFEHLMPLNIEDYVL